MRLAVYNVENLFDRAKAMNLESWSEGRPVLERFAKLNQLLGQVEYSDADRTQIAKLVVELGMEKSDTGPFVLLRRNRGGLQTLWPLHRAAVACATASPDAEAASPRHL